jgi:hypothetical protein
MTSQTIKTALFALLISTVGLLVAAHFSTKLPFAFAYGCDSYGYLRQAELFSQKGPVGGLDTAIESENAAFLVGIASQINTNASRWSEMIAPHCHHYKQANHKIILQYPPGTGFVLSLLPSGRELETLSLLLVLSLIFWWGLLNLRQRRIAVFVISTASLILLLATAVQFQVPSYSVPLTILMLAWLALLLFEIRYVLTFKNLVLAVFIGLLVGTLLTVRIASVIVLPAIAAIAFFKIIEAIEQKKFSSIVLIAGVSSFACAVLPLLVANLVNAGSPFESTYNDYDKKISFGNSELLLNNLSYYLIENRVAALSILALSVLALVLTQAKTYRSAEYRITLALVLVFIADLLFLSMKMVAIDYYFLPTAAFSLYAGLLLYSGSHKMLTQSASTPVQYIVPVFAFLLLAFGAYKFQTTSKVDIDLVAPAEILRPDSIVYADNSGGALSHYKQKYTAKVDFGNYCMREQLINRVQAAGRTQYFVNDSAKMTETLEAIGIERFKSIGTFSSQHFKFDVLQLLPFDAAVTPKINCDFGSETEIVSKVQLQPIGKVVGEKFVGDVIITNFSSTPFSTVPNAFPVRLSWRFVNVATSSAQPDWLARQDLRTVLVPGVPYQVPVSITVPKKAGDYDLEFSLVQEGYVWFHDRGMPIAKFRLSVSP